DAGVAHGRMPAQHELDLGGRHRGALDLDELLQAIADLELPVVADRDEVAGAQPAVGREDRGGLLGQAVVALHDLRAANPELARLARLDVRAGPGVDEPRLGAGDEPAGGPWRARTEQGSADRAR